MPGNTLNPIILGNNPILLLGRWAYSKYNYDVAQKKYEIEHDTRVARDAYEKAVGKAVADLHWPAFDRLTKQYISEADNVAFAKNKVLDGYQKGPLGTFGTPLVAHGTGLAVALVGTPLAILAGGALDGIVYNYLGTELPRSIAEHADKAVIPYLKRDTAMATFIASTPNGKINAAKYLNSRRLGPAKDIPSAQQFYTSKVDESTIAALDAQTKAIDAKMQVCAYDALSL